LVPILIEAVKELKAEISELQTKRAPSAFDSPKLQEASLFCAITLAPTRQ
jgi:hypothetical protein